MGTGKPVVTISATYGAGGGLVGPRVAERLDVRFWDRAIPASVAAEMAERPEEVLAVEDDLGRGFSHWVSFFAAAGMGWAAILPADWEGPCDEASYKQHIGSVLRREAAHGAVFLGRGAAIVLADYPGALHVRLDGPVGRRIAQVVDIGGLDERSAQQAQQQTDTARHRYVRRLYHADPADHRHYHLLIDATAVPFATCADVIVSAVRGRDALRQLQTDDDPP